MMYLNASVNKIIRHTISLASSPFEAMQIIDANYGESETQDCIDLLLRLENMKFRINYDKSRFVSDFEHLMEDFAQRGLIYPHPIQRILFLFKIIRDNDDPASPLGVFYSQMSAVQPKNCTFAYTKNQFLNFDLGNLSRRSRSNYGESVMRSNVEDQLTSAIDSSVEPVSR